MLHTLIEMTVLAHEMRKSTCYEVDRSDLRDMLVEWAAEFEEVHRKTDWEENDWFETIEKFTFEKMQKL